MDQSWMCLLDETTEIKRVMEANTYTSKFYLTLTEQDVRYLLEKRRECLWEQRRVEFGAGILQELIMAFCDSAYIHQENYVETIERLQDIFYLYKNESMDEITDDELIEYMRHSFEHECQGSLEYLEDTCLEDFARHIRKRTRKFIGRYVEDE